MNPWIHEQLGAAHREELRRVAAAGIYPSDESRSDQGLRPSAHRALHEARRSLGSLLIRAGSRVGGPDALPRPVRTA